MKRTRNKPRDWAEYLWDSGHDEPYVPAWREWPDGSFVAFWMPERPTDTVWITAVWGAGRRMMEWLENAARAAGRSRIMGCTKRVRAAERVYGFQRVGEPTCWGHWILKEL